MTIITASPTTTFNMIGGYNTEEVLCPFCKQTNIFLLMEGPTSPVKSYQVCPHIHSRVINEEGCSEYDFWDDTTKKSAPPTAKKKVTPMTLKNRFFARLDKAQYALACDDEANLHYVTTHRLIRRCFLFH